VRRMNKTTQWVIRIIFLIIVIVFLWQQKVLNQ